MKREYDFSKAKRGAVMPVSKGKTRITIRLDEGSNHLVPGSQVDKAGGGNYQSLINEALREHIARAREPLGSHPAASDPGRDPSGRVALAQ